MPRKIIKDTKPKNVLIFDQKKRKKPLLPVNNNNIPHIRELHFRPKISPTVSCRISKLNISDKLYTRIKEQQIKESKELIGQGKALINKYPDSYKGYLMVGANLIVIEEFTEANKYLHMALEKVQGSVHGSIFKRLYNYFIKTPISKEQAKPLFDIYYHLGRLAFASKIY
ncbi:MAG: hypothetical protein ABIH39_01215, partial [Candidatus Margulisiibacteriota bacterium]